MSTTLEGAKGGLEVMRLRGADTKKIPPATTTGERASRAAAAKKDPREGLVELEKSDKHFDPEEAKRAIAGRTGSVEVVDEDGSSKIEDNGGDKLTIVDGKPKIGRTEGSDKRIEKIKNLESAFSEAVVKGYEGSSPDTRRILKSTLTDFLNNNKDYLVSRGIDPRDKVAVRDFILKGVAAADAHEMLKDRTLMENFTNGYIQFADNGEAIDYATLHQKLLEQAEIDGQIDNTNKRLNDSEPDSVVAKLKEVEEELHEFRDNPSLDKNTPPDRGTFTLQRIEAEKDILKESQALQEKQRILRDLKSGGRHPDSTVSTLELVGTSVAKGDSTETARLKLEQEIADHQENLVEAQSRREGIIKKETDLKEQKKQLESDKVKLESDKIKLAKDKIAKDAEVEKAKLGVKAEEEGLLADMKEILTGATMETWKEAAEEYIAKLNDLRSDAEKIAFDRINLKLMKKLQKDTPSKMRERRRAWWREARGKRGIEFDQRKVASMVEDIVKNGYDKDHASYGSEGTYTWAENSLTSILISYNGPSASPEERAMAASILDMKTSRPSEYKAMLKAHTENALALAATQAPELLDTIFKKNEAMLRHMAGDMLPDIIASARENTKFQELFAKYTDDPSSKDLSKEQVRKMIGRMDKSKLSKLTISSLVALGLLGMAMKRVLKD